MRIRKLNLSDCHKVWRLAREYIVGMYDKTGFEVDEGKLKFGMVQYQNWTYGLETDEGELVGVLAGDVIPITLTGEPMWSEALFYVDKKYARYVKRFVTDVQKDLKSHGVRFMTLALASNYKGLRHLYKRFKFKFLNAHYISKL